MTGPCLALLLITAEPACAYLRVPKDAGATCTGPSTGIGAPPCETGLPPGLRPHRLADGRVCAGGHSYELIPTGVLARSGPSVPLPEAAVIARLCAAGRRPRPARRRWWLPQVSVSFERGLAWAADGSGFSLATTVWVSLAFPLASAAPTPEASPTPGASHFPESRRRRELCAAAARLGRAFSRVGDVGLRTRARLQLMAWRDELSPEASDGWVPAR